MKTHNSIRIRVENSKKLVQLEVFFADHKRQILAGMKTERVN